MVWLSKTFVARLKLAAILLANSVAVGKLPPFRKYVFDEARKIEDAIEESLRVGIDSDSYMAVYKSLETGQTVAGTMYFAPYMGYSHSESLIDFMLKKLVGTIGSVKSVTEIDIEPVVTLLKQGYLVKFLHGGFELQGDFVPPLKEEEGQVLLLGCDREGCRPYAMLHMIRPEDGQLITALHKGQLLKKSLPQFTRPVDPDFLVLACASLTQRYSGNKLPSEFYLFHPQTLDFKTVSVKTYRDNFSLNAYKKMAELPEAKKILSSANHFYKQYFYDNLIDNGSMTDHVKHCFLNQFKKLMQNIAQVKTMADLVKIKVEKDYGTVELGMNHGVRSDLIEGIVYEFHQLLEKIQEAITEVISKHEDTPVFQPSMAR